MALCTATGVAVGRREGARDGQKEKNLEMLQFCFKDQILLHTQFGKDHSDGSKELSRLHLHKNRYSQLIRLFMSHPQNSTEVGLPS